MFAVLALPPRSGASGASLDTSNALIAPTISAAALSRPKRSSIMVPAHTVVIGLAVFLPTMSGGACTGSNIDGNCFSGLRLAGGARPLVAHRNRSPLIVRGMRQSVIETSSRHRMATMQSQNNPEGRYPGASTLVFGGDIS